MESGVIEGRCLCGALSYRAAGTLFHVICCCEDCQRTSGAGHLPVIGVPREGFEVQGQPLRYESVGGSGRTAARNFCGVCGSVLFGESEQMPDVVSIYAGTLHEPKRFRPTGAFYLRDKCDWDVIPEGLNVWQAGFVPDGS